MIREIARFEPDLILLSDTGIRSTTDVLKYFRKQNRCVIVQWLADLIDSFPFVYENLKYCDRFYVANPFEAARVKELNLCRTEYLPLACWPETERTVSLSAKDKAFYGTDVSFVGTVKKALVNRSGFFDELLNGELDFGVRIWDFWAEDLIKTHPQFTEYVQTRPVSSMSRTRVYNASKINLNIQHEGIVGIGNLRFFGIPASGGFQLCNKRDQAHLFEPYLGDLIRLTAFFNTVKEFKESVRYYLKNEKERMEMAEEAHRIVHEKHTYALRVKEIINDVGLT
ncbi:MAG: glycosyltransferase [Thermodesulfobacteriota bacterium]|nr:glycosyltransferase [Thermodesulfobacteriota bacterium]